MLLVPAGGRPMQRPNDRRGGPAQLQLQQIGEELVVAILKSNKFQGGLS